MKKLLLKTTVLTVLTVIFLTLTAAAASLGTAIVNADALRLRSEPSTNGKILTHLNSGDRVDVLEIQGDWYKVSFGGYEGYVSAPYLDYTATAPSAAAEAKAAAQIEAILEQAPETPLQGIVTGDVVNVRSIPSTEGDILTKVYAGNLVDLVAKDGGWYTITFQDRTAYISADYVREYDPADSTIGDQIVELALSYLGTPYRYGGMSPKGFDCSGFTLYIFKQFGFELSHSATSQWYNSGEEVAREDLQPGDLVLFCDPAASNGKACSHVGIYIGDNEFVHAASGRRSGRKVIVSSLSETYWDTYYKGAKRVG